MEFATGIAHENRLAPIEAAIYAAEKGYSHFYINIGQNKISQSELFDLKAIIGKNKLNPIVHCKWRNEISSSIESMRQKACECIFEDIEIAYQMSAPLIVHGTIDASFKTEKDAHPNALQDFKNSFEKIHQRALLKNVELWIENLPSNEAAIFTNNDEYKTILNAFENVKFVYDIGHGNIGNNPISTFEIFHKKIVALSLSDNDSFRDTHEPLGTGTIDFTRLIEMIKLNKWCGIIIFDMHTDEILSSIDYLNQLLKK